MDEDVIGLILSLLEVPCLNTCMLVCKTIKRIYLKEKTWERAVKTHTRSQRLIGKEMGMRETIRLSILERSTQYVFLLFDVELATMDPRYKSPKIDLQFPNDQILESFLDPPIVRKTRPIPNTLVRHLVFDK